MAICTKIAKIQRKNGKIAQKFMQKIVKNGVDQEDLGGVGDFLK
jgi:hypothetical protein